MEPTAKEKLEQVEKICRSGLLQQSELLKAFLHYVVTKTVEDPAAQLKEYTIATEVFGRDKKFDPRNDPVVRVQANRLRAKLQKYYANEANGDKVLIDLPKGHYIPTFSYLHKDDGLNAPDEDAHSLTTSASLATDAAASVSSSSARWVGAMVGLAILSLMLGFTTIYYRSQSKQPAAPVDSKTGPQKLDSDDAEMTGLLWSDFLHPTIPILVTYSNTTFLGTPQQGLKYYKPLASGSAKSNSFQQRAGRLERNARPISDHYTGIGEVMAVFFLGNVFWKTGQPFHVKRSLLLDWQDIKTSNIVVLGSTAENLFLRDLPQKQDFVFLADKDHNHDLVIVNLHPQEGEQKLYSIKRDGPSTEQIVEDYALVSLLRGLDGRSKIIVLAGLTTIGTQAAAEYVTKPEYIKDLISHLNISTDPASPKLPTSYQIVIRARVNGGVPVQIDYVAHHVL